MCWDIFSKLDAYRRSIKHHGRVDDDIGSLGSGFLEGKRLANRS